MQKFFKNAGTGCFLFSRDIISVSAEKKLAYQDFDLSAAIDRKCRLNPDITRHGDWKGGHPVQIDRLGPGKKLRGISKLKNKKLTQLI